MILTSGATLAAILGLISAVSWGAGDFCGGLSGKHATTYTVVIVSQVFGLIAIALGALALRQPIPPLSHWIGGAVAGIVGVVGLLSLYQALANGQMGLTAPVSAVVSAIVPVVFGIFTLGLPNLVTLIGFVVALIAVWFIARSGDGQAIQLRTLTLPLIAGISFGLFYVIISRVNTVSALWPLVGARLGSLTAMLIFTRLTHQPIAPPRGMLPLLGLTGVLDAGGNVFYALAAATGRFDIAAVLASLYPASTIILAWLITKELFTRTRVIGIGLALVAIVMITVAA